MSLSINLQRKVEQSIHLLESLPKGIQLEVAYSGGKDSDVILHLAKQVPNLNFKAVYKLTTIDPAGTIAHVRSKGVEILKPKESFFTLFDRKGMPNRWRRWCCSALKEYFTSEWMCTGVRRSESRARTERYQEPIECRAYCKNKRSQIVMPILFWDDEDMEEYIEENDIQCHPLYYDENGKFRVRRRLGCMCCPLKSPIRRIEEFKKNPQMLRLYLKHLFVYFKKHIDKPFNELWEYTCEKFFASVWLWRNPSSIHEYRTTLFGTATCQSMIEYAFNVDLKDLYYQLFYVEEEK